MLGFRNMQEKLEKKFDNIRFFFRFVIDFVIVISTSLSF